MFDWPVAVPPQHRLPFSYRAAKRGFDFWGAFLLLLILSPVFLIVILAVKLSSKGSVFYCCNRVGRNGKLFKFIKFRSMYVDADRRLAELKALNEKDGPIFKIVNDPRITPVGRFLRKYSLDELPQIYHVLTGKMSLVGPRPPLPHEVAHYDPTAMLRLSVKPGLTCYWQIKGRSKLSFREWIELDNRYISEMCFWTDLKILFLTPISVLRGDGAY